MSDSLVSSIYLHFPYCKHLCNYCDFYKLKLVEDKRQINFAYLEKYLNQSFEMLLDLLTREGKALAAIETIYFGGGTPSLWGQEGISFIDKWFKKHNIVLAKNYEWTLEVDPGAASIDQLQLWRELGVNRFSVGVQSLNPQIFSLMDRSHSLEQVYELLEILKKLEVNFSVDFMLGLPSSIECKRSIQSELKSILSYSPNHLSLYFLTVPTNYKHYHLLPSDDWIGQEYHEVQRYLKSLGFNHYEVASFAKENFESKHNRRYWTHESVLAIGPSATGFLKNNLRYKWSSNWLGDIGAKFEVELLNKEELILEKIYLTLRQGKFFSLEQLCQLDLIPARVTEIFERWTKLNYLEVDEQGLVKMSASGWLILDVLVQEILTYKVETPS